MRCVRKDFMPDSKEIMLDIAIPVLNEENRLKSGIEKLITFLKTENLLSQTQLSIADNGSTDRTEEHARELVNIYSNVRYLKVGQKGVGLALKKAWGDSTGHWVGYMDVDLAADIKHIKDVFRLLLDEQIEVVTGSRLLAESEVVNRMLTREITSRGFNKILQSALGIHFTDGMCGFKFIKRSIFDLLMERGVHNDEWFFCTEFLVKAEWLGFNIHELPVHWTDDRDSKVELWKTIAKYLKEIRRLKLEKKQYERKV